MTITLVDVGTTANDGTGDPLRTAFQTVNTALTRLDNTVNVQTGYVLLKDDSGSTGVVVTTAGNVGIGTTSPSNHFLHVLRSGGSTAGVARFESTLTNVAADVEIIDQDNSATRSALEIKGNAGAIGIALFRSNGRINMPSLPTSSAGLATGDLWNDSGTLKIV
jgi:hypothetical protein